MSSFQILLCLLYVSYLYTYIYTYIRIYTHIYVYIYIYIYIYIYTNVKKPRLAIDLVLYGNNNNISTWLWPLTVWWRYEFIDDAIINVFRNIIILLKCQ